ncbi:MAG: excalibur calcium-binding domain-containing protein [Actinomycetaceae bacterium]|nr:excalibur calcium-binding domain-containing protein [Actinomycetaceae bacterium]
MAQTFTGTIVKWNDERGFGFIKEDVTGSEIFAHIKDFKKRAVPKVGEKVLFGIGHDKSGRKKACDVLFADKAQPSGDARAAHTRQRKNSRQDSRRKKNTIFETLIVVAIIGVVGGVLYPKLEARHHRKSLAAQPAVAVPSADANARFSCDGRQLCSEMKSCEEAIFFINNCPGTKMDGDNDGIPCEGHLC